MKFSIVTPSFNQGRYVGHCIDSVLSQKGNFEIQYLVLDNFSSDNSWKNISSRLAATLEPRIQFSAVQCQDLGQADAINKGLLQCDGDIFAFLNSDDVLAPESLVRVQEAFDENPDIDFVYGRAHFIDENNTITGDYDTFDIKNHKLCSHCFISQPATFFRQRAYKHLGPFSLTLENSFDYEYWLRAVHAGFQFKYLPDFLASTRLHGGTKSFNNRADIHRENFLIQLKYCGGISDEIYHQYLLENSTAQKVLRYFGMESTSLAISLRRIMAYMYRKQTIEELKGQLDQYF